MSEHGHNSGVPPIQDWLDGPYERYDTDTAAGLLLEGIFLDNPEHTSYLRQRGVTFYAPLVASHGVVGEVNPLYDRSSSYIMGLYAIAKSEKACTLPDGSFEKARDALLSGHIEQTEWMDYIIEPIDPSED